MEVHIFYPPNETALSLLQENLDPEIELTLGDQNPAPVDYCILTTGVPNQEFLEAEKKETRFFQKTEFLTCYC